MLKKRKRTTKWTKLEEQYLKEHCAGMVDAEVAKKLRKTLRAVREKRIRLGLQKKSGRGVNELVNKDGVKKPKTNKQAPVMTEQEIIDMLAGTSINLG